MSCVCFSLCFGFSLGLHCVSRFFHLHACMYCVVGFVFVFVKIVVKVLSFSLSFGSVARTHLQLCRVKRNNFLHFCLIIINIVVCFFPFQCVHIHFAWFVASGMVASGRAHSLQFSIYRMHFISSIICARFLGICTLFHIAIQYPI